MPELGLCHKVMAEERCQVNDRFFGRKVCTPEHQNQMWEFLKIVLMIEPLDLNARFFCSLADDGFHHRAQQNVLESDAGWHCQIDTDAVIRGFQNFY